YGKRASQTVLRKFPRRSIIDGRYPCSFKIINENSAVLEYGDRLDVVPVIEQFRFFAEHINVFYNANGSVVAEYPPVTLKTVSLEEIQPSQFYADRDKVEAVQSFIRSGADIIIPVLFRMTKTRSKN
ncbi:MAG: hypothetical protein NC394_08670, partial [Bacteroides sp.]|nr:hypothetical protein [Bacteroides sp.]